MEIKKIKKILNYYEIPIFFIGEDYEGKHYLLLDEYDSEYLATEVNDAQLEKLLTHQLTPYDFYKTSDCFLLKYDIEKSTLIYVRKVEPTDDLLIEPKTFID